MRRALLLVVALIAVAAPAATLRATADGPASAGVGPIGNEASALLDALGVRKIYFMAGPTVLRANLRVLGSDGLAPATVQPKVTSVSNLSGNGSTVVFDGSVSANLFGSDQSLRLRGDAVVPIPQPRNRTYAPTIVRDGTLAAIQPGGGFLTLSPGRNQTWRHDPRLRRVRVVPIEWGPGDQAFTVLRPGSTKARLVLLRGRHGVRKLGDAYCASSVLVAPTRRVLVLEIPHNKADVAGCGTSSLLLDFGGKPVSGTVPDGWRPLAWSADSTRLLVVHRDVVAVVDLEGNEVARVDLGTGVWDAAAIH